MSYLPVLMKNIENKITATLADCESEPIHTPGSIQPHGFLLAVDAQGAIRFCSENCTGLFRQPLQALLQQNLASIVPDVAPGIMNEIERGAATGKPLLLDHAGERWAVFICRSNDGIFIIEWERHQVYEEEDLFEQTRQFVHFIERSKNLQELCQRIAEQTRAITGYDRVMIYCFDAEYNGQVLAESKDDRLEPFLNLHYPHTDIPPQARELYLRNLMRMIVDVNYTPVPIFTMDDRAPLDMSDAVLRSVSPIHIQYLKNMGVGATLTISLVLEGRLWGLISCHHNSPRHLNVARRRAALMQGHFLTSQIKVRQAAEEYEVNVAVEAHLQQLLHVIPQEGDFALKFQNFSSLLSLTNASGVAVLHKGQLYEKGLVPPREQTRSLLNWLADKVAGLQFVTANLQAFYPDAEKISRQASGILYHKLGDPHKDAVIWFREELDKTINWAGNPHDAVKRAPATNMLTPRSSFAIFRERVRFHSKEWRLSEVNAANRFASTLQNQFHLEYLRQEEAKQRLLNEQLSKANQELANINWITTHDLKEPVRKILLFASRVMSSEGTELSESITQSIAKIQSSAERMKKLVEDIISYSLANDRQSAFVPTDLNELLKDVLEEFVDDLHAKSARWFADKLPQLPVIPYQIRQLFVNLIGNAIKFARPGVPLEIEISCAEVSGAPSMAMDQHYYRISFRDNGIGFNPAQAVRIFDIFYRLHDQQSYAGTGIGLAICKRIAENHGGTVTASGTEGAGAVFHVYLPRA